jgi:endonuclease/exonuclease/phosphatase (EEP) superfamily protein YafD
MEINKNQMNRRFISPKQIAIALVIILGLLVFIAAASSLWGWSFLLERLSHFQAQYFLIGLITFCFLAITKQKYPILIGLALLIMLSVPSLNWFIPRLSFENSANDTLRILVANVWERNINYGAAIALAREEKPNIAVFMEVSPIWQNQLDSLQDILPYATGSGTGNMIYSDRPLENTEIRKFSDSWGSNTIISEIRLDKNESKKFTFIATHPSAPMYQKMFQSRNEHLERMGEFIKNLDGAVVVAGDFNVTMWSPYYRKFVSETKLINARAGFGILPTWSPSSRTKLPIISLLSVPIDHVFYRSVLKNKFSVMNARVGKDIDSDHFPLIVDMEL